MKLVFLGPVCLNPGRSAMSEFSVDHATEWQEMLKKNANVKKVVFNFANIVK